jgi:outer membrane protein assembly factor BamB
MLTALHVRDGRVVWQREGWSLRRAAELVLDDGMLLADTIAPRLEDTCVSALDPGTGETRWSHDTGFHWSIDERLRAARAGRAYVWEERDTHVLRVLDSHTGDVVWSVEQSDPFVQLSPEGKLAVVGTTTTAGDVARTVRNTEDGAIVATLPRTDQPLALTDDGVVYVMLYSDALVARRIGEGAELWRASDIEPRHVIVTDSALYCGWLTRSPRELAAVIALDSRTGQRLWRWRSPAHLAGLLRLWGRQTPQVALYALSQARRSINRARDAHDRGIFYREVLNGQWRRPASLIGNIQLAAGAGIVFVATNMGLFALNAGNGRLLWHALPTSDLSQNTPVVAPA